MTWRPEDPQGKETAKTRWRAAPYTRGRGLDLGCGAEKIWDTKNVVGVDSCKDSELFGHVINPDIKADVESLPLFASGSVDFVFSSHVLEHIEYRKVPEVLKEWFRTIKTGGYLVPRRRAPRGISCRSSGAIRMANIPYFSRSKN